ncbi:glycosyltransferase [Cyclobacterium xiamenense]|uniref:glycosyltransferase n=1 Tax=Cyclobacterium xiamenense TaxID=1297121 RepID=UPI0035D0293E
MKTVVFHILPTSSHLNASYKLAKSLQSGGNRIVYFSSPDRQSHFRSLGFEFFSYPRDHFPLNQKKKGQGIFKNAFMAYKIKRNYGKTFLKGNFYDELLYQISPDLIVVDLSLIYFSVFLYKKKVPFMITCTKVCLNRSPYVPPFTSSYIPMQDSVFSKILVEWLWLKRLSVYRLRSLRDHYLTIGKISPYRLCKIYAQKAGLNFGKLTITDRSSHFGWKYVPEIILSPKEFDFPRDFSLNQFHIGPVVDMKRNETDCDSSFPLKMEKIDEMINYEGKKLVYCAMGSYDFKHRQKRIVFYTKILQVFINNPKLILVLSTGKDIYLRGDLSGSSNIFIFQKVPQLALLNKASLMINHGGMQSVTECILSGVPMLVFPLDLNLDQKGNSARVCYHGVGLSGDLNRDSSELIKAKVTKLLDNDVFRNKTINMMKELNKSRDFKSGLSLISDYLN